VDAPRPGVPAPASAPRATVARRRAFAPRLQRPGLFARLREWLRGPPPPRTAPRVFVAGEVRAVACVHLVSGGFGLLGAVIGIVSLVVLTGVVLLLVGNGPTTARTSTVGMLPVIAFVAGSVFFTGTVAFVQARAAVRLLDGDARGHRVLGVLTIVQTVFATAYLIFATVSGRPAGHLVQIGLGVLVIGWCLFVLHRWRPGSAGAEAAPERA
jgi:hypothetical protein